MLPNVEQSQQARRAAIAEWRKSRTHEATLPSGLPVVLRDATIMDLMVGGNIPQTLLDIIVKSAEQGSGQVDLQTFSGAQGFGQLVNELVKICLVEPAIAVQADDDHITLDELSGDDRMFVFNWANREVSAAEPFRAPAVQPVVAARAE
jgi:hypothetical protein